MEDLATVPLLIVDDLECASSRRRPRRTYWSWSCAATNGSALSTSNRPVDDWGTVLGAAAAVAAMLDRLLHHGHVLKCGPRRWRTKIVEALPAEEATR
jgi:DNA replication protein DnaC